LGPPVSINMQSYSYLAGESTILLYSCRLGLTLSLAYDFFRIIRSVIRCNKIMVGFMDMLFWAFTAYRTFYMMHTHSNGTLRWFAILGTISVIGIYMMFVSKHVVNVGRFILGTFCKVLSQLFTWMKKCLTNILKVSIIKLVGKYQKKGEDDGKTRSIPDKVSQ